MPVVEAVRNLLGGAQKRRAARLAAPADLRVRVRGPAGPLSDFRVSDLSRGGLGLVSDYPVAIGSRLQFTIERGSESIEVEAVVRWRSEGGVSRRFGVEFVAPGARLAALAPLFA
ncbi:MAG: PilZ domain-containing protein [Planctomycetes bacterium]|nr:PilZ domain-containing protein [Planctomycetota bacterium]